MFALKTTLTTAGFACTTTEKPNLSGSCLLKLINKLWRDILTIDRFHFFHSVFNCLFKMSQQPRDFYQIETGAKECNLWNTSYVTEL